MPLENSPFFSIIVPVYNVERYLHECVNSVLSQSFQDYELILVDDGSSDDSGEICDDYERQQKSRVQHDKNQSHTLIIPQIPEKVNIIVIHQQNQGLSATRNAGATKASGEYLVFLDGDDFLEPGALTAIHREIEPGLDLLRYQAQEVFDDGKTIRHEETGFATIPGVEAFNKLARYHYTENAWLYAYRTKFFRGNHFRYAEGCLAEDLGLTPLIITKATSVKSIPDICYDYRQRTGSIMHDQTKVARRMHDIMLQFHEILPEIAAIPHTETILHYLVVSFLTGATELERIDFLQIYQDSKRAGLLKYIRPASIKALPRSLILRYFPKMFYRIYHH